MLILIHKPPLYSLVCLIAHWQFYCFKGLDSKPVNSLFNICPCGVAVHWCWMLKASKQPLICNQRSGTGGDIHVENGTIENQTQRHMWCCIYFTLVCWSKWPSERYRSQKVNNIMYAAVIQDNGNWKWMRMCSGPNKARRDQRRR